LEGDDRSAVVDTLKELDMDDNALLAVISGNPRDGCPLYQIRKEQRPRLKEPSISLRRSDHLSMRRRDLIAIVAGIAALPLAALAQQADPLIAPFTRGCGRYRPRLSRCSLTRSDPLGSVHFHSS
jgi:hypothetical protein